MNQAVSDGAAPRRIFWPVTEDYIQRRKSIATKALQEFLLLEKMRPVYGRAAFDNHNFIKVLEKCSFQRIGTGQGFANARGKKIEEI
ncbi:MAG TPA: hypothetical protein VK927_08050, partial [Adhaeribacter sp.]|nr:hypothetical protein [Adhaeribacter sp.]